MFDPTSQALVLVKILMQGRIERARRTEGGASAVEWVLISALLVGVAIAVGIIIMRKLTDKANDLDLG